MTNHSPEIILHLSLIEGVGDSTIGVLVRQCTAEQIPLSGLYAMSVNALARSFHLSQEKAGLIVAGLANGRKLERELSLIEKNNIAWMTMVCDGYPRLLRAIHAPPAILYWRGEPLQQEEYAVAVIGSRRVNYYGLSVIELLVPPLVAQGWTIVSGGAIGADSKAHEIAVRERGKTIAVLGAGLLKPYPACNRVLFDRIVQERGTLISPFPLTMPAAPGNFPARNRIIAGLSYGCLVVQAAAASGTHITAQYALEEGRELFAVPGCIDDSLSTGCHSLIQQGAKLVHTAEDILLELAAIKPLKAQNMASDTHNHQNEPCASETPEALIAALCRQPCTIDELAQMTGKAVHELYTLLFMLEVNGVLIRQANGTWMQK